MSWITILSQIIQLIWALIGIWKQGGGDVVKQVLADHHKRVCDEVCQIELKAQLEREKI